MECSVCLVDGILSERMEVMFTRGGKGFQWMCVDHVCDVKSLSVKTKYSENRSQKADFKQDFIPIRASGNSPYVI